jgi:hypothetical protein
MRIHNQPRDVVGFIRDQRLVQKTLQRCIGKLAEAAAIPASSSPERAGVAWARSVFKFIRDHLRL